MCLQCLTKAAIILEDAIDGYSLMIATKEHPEWPKGYYGLVVCNDPDFVWPGIIPDPLDGMTDEQIDCLDDGDERLQKSALHFELVTSIEPLFTSDPLTVYEFVKACIKSGYNPEQYGSRVVSWFINHIAKRVKA